MWWDVVFHNTDGPVSKVSKRLEDCLRCVATSRDGFLGYAWPARRQGVTIPAQSEMVVWGRAKAMSQ